MPSQQPFGHDVALQAHIVPPPPHVVPAPHEKHVVPFPQRAVPLPVVWQTPAESQQPLGHVVALQMHSPPLQSWVGAQVLQTDPPRPQVLLFCVVTHLSPLQHPLHDVVGSQIHCPARHPVPAAHGAQASPPVLHAASLGV